MIKIVASVLMMLSVLGLPLAALSQTAPMVITPTPVSDTMLKQGTPLRLRTLLGLNSDDAREGQRFDLEVTQDVLVNGIAIIPRGSLAQGEVTTVRKKGMWGASGKLSVRLISVRAFGKDIPIRNDYASKGSAGTGGVVAAIVFVPLAGFFVTGTSATIPSGTEFSAAVDADIPLVFSK